MAGPFPGMDPWLEEPILWTGVHQRLITYIADALQPLLGDRYVASIEERLYVSTNDRMIGPDVAVRHQPEVRGAPAIVAVIEPDEAVIVEFVDEEVREGYIEILDLHADEQLVTVIECLSPSNKAAGEGREQYLKKQREILGSTANLVEVDLLRGGAHTVAISEEDILRVGEFDYVITISRARDRHKRSLFYARTVRDRLPRIAIPLQGDDPDVTLDVQAVVDQVFQAGRYGGRLRYSKPCVPRLRPEDQNWAKERIDQWQKSHAS